MIDTLPPQTPEEVAAERRRHDESVAGRWPIVVGLVGTVAFHLLAYFAVDRQLFGWGGPVAEVPSDVATMREKYDQQELTFLLADDTSAYRLRRTRAGDAWDRSQAESCGVPAPASASAGGGPVAVGLGMPTIRTAVG